MKKGAITIYLSLILVLLLSFFLGVIEHARANAMEMKAECAVDLAFESALAEYQRELLEEYELFFIDMGYGCVQGAPEYTAEHIREYLDKNLNPFYQTKDMEILHMLESGLTKDFYKMKARDVELYGVSLATDQEGQVFVKQAVDSVKNKYGITLAEDILQKNNLFTGYGLHENEDRAYKEWEEKKQELEDYYFEHPQDQSKTVVYERLAKEEGERDGLIMPIVLGGKVAGLSTKLELLDNHVSHRQSKNQGNLNIVETSKLTDIENNILLGEYILEKGGYFGSESDNETLRCGAEYVIQGSNNDWENVEGVVRRILLLREIMNVIYIHRDAGKMSVINGIAEAISLLTLGCPKELFAELIVFGWAYIESIQDARTLLHGGKVPLLKGSAEEGTGFDYKDYLRCFLLISSMKQKAFRMMDLIEVRVRKTEGNQYFKMDNCMDHFIGTASIESQYGYEFTFEKEKYYPTSVE